MKHIQSKKIPFTTFTDRFISENPQSKLMPLVKKHFLLFAKREMYINDIDRDTCKEFATYLSKNINRSASILFIVFKQLINNALDKKLIDDPYIKQKIHIKYKPPKREYLTPEEIKLMIDTKTPFDDVRLPFLFSCFTGLRFCDLQNLKWENISGDRLTITMRKTKEPLTLKLNKYCLDILSSLSVGNVFIPSEFKIFHLTSHETWRRRVKLLIKHLGIDKIITGHCARHSFATLCINRGVDIYVLKDLLGHKDVATTQIYAHVPEEKKDDAIDKLIL